MKLFIIGLIVGIGKIIPGVSGAILAISFKVYDKLINSVTHFFDDYKSNLKFLIKIGLGILLSIIIFSNIILYLFTDYKFILMMFFLGLIIPGIYEYRKNINFNIKNIIIIFIIIFIFIFLTKYLITDRYILKNNFFDYIMYFLSGFIEIFASIVPGISGTVLLMIIGMYENSLSLISNLYNTNYILSNIDIYISYGLGMIISFILVTLLIDYLLRKKKSLLDILTFSFCISGIISLIILIFKSNFTIIDIILGVVLLFIGIIIGFLTNKC